MGNYKIIYFILISIFFKICPCFSQIDTAQVKRLYQFETKNNGSFELAINKELQDFLYEKTNELNDEEFGIFSSYVKCFKSIINSKEKNERFYANLLAQYYNSTELNRILEDKVNNYRTSVIAQRKRLPQETILHIVSQKKYIDIEDLNIVSSAPMDRAKNETFLEIILDIFEFICIPISGPLCILSILGFTTTFRPIPIVLAVISIVLGVFFGIRYEKKMTKQLNEHVKEYVERNHISISKQLDNESKIYYEQLIKI